MPRPFVELPFTTHRGVAGRLRPWRMGDAEALARIADHPEIGRGLRDRFPSPYTLNDAIEWLSWLEAHDGERTRGWPTVFCIEVGGAPVGGIGFEPLDDIHRLGAECGYWLTPAAWNQGLATASLLQLVQYVFDRTEIIRLYAGVFPWNAASVRVLEQAGFAYEATLKQALVKQGQVYDELIYVRLKHPS